MGSGMESCVRYLLFFFNLIFALTGLAIVALGGLTMYALYERQYSSFVDENFRYVPIVMLVVGGVIAVIAFFGCCGSVKENHCMLYAFGVFLVMILLIEIGVGVTGYIFQGELNESLESGIKRAVDEYHSSTDASKMIDGLQLDLQCCGANGPADYNNNLPDSCCLQLGFQETCTPNLSSQQGCFPAVKDYIKNISVILLSIAGGVGIVELIGIFFAFCLANSIKRGYEQV